MNRRVVIHAAALTVLLAAMAGLAHLVLRDGVATAEESTAPIEDEPALDTAAYDAKLWQIAGTDPASTEPPLWPVTDNPYPEYGAILPFNRIVAYYGNFYSTGMGILGQYAEDTVIEMLRGEVAKWEEADPTTPVVPAIDYIAVTAQWNPGEDGMYRFRMSASQIEKAIAMAERVDGIVILEVQAGLSEVMTEVKALEPYLSLPQVHLAIDPEFAMIGRGLPGRVVGTVDASHVNAAAEYLASLVEANDLPSKVLVIHRYTKAMVTNVDQITPLPQVQIVMDMDGWGPPSQKYATYNAYIYPEPVQFTGFKLFYRNDTLSGRALLTPQEVLELTPRPIFIQYQ